jgi:hypothetical protein
MFGAFQVGNQPATFPTAFPNVNTKNACGNTPLGPNGNYDRWQIPFGAVNCTPPAGNIFITELDVAQAQIGTVPNTQTPNLNGFNCSP